MEEEKEDDKGEDGERNAKGKKKHGSAKKEHREDDEGKHTVKVKEQEVKKKKHKRVVETR